MEVTDRIASLEQRVQMQEDEIQLLKSALADVVRRLNVSEEQQALGSRRGPTKGSKLRFCFPFYESSKCNFPPFSLISHEAQSEWRLFPSILVLPLFLSSLSALLPGLCPFDLLCVAVCRPCSDEKVYLSRRQCRQVR